MQDFLGGVVIVNAELVSLLLALWMTWGLLRLLFRLMPASPARTAVPAVRPVRTEIHGHSQIPSRKAA